jgi:hypothetical protein
LPDPSRADPGLYGYWPYKDRPKIVWPGGRKLALWVAPNIEFYELRPPANPHRKAWPNPVPDVPGYAYRDHGNRVGNHRLMAAMARHDVPGSVSLSVAMCQHWPRIVEEVNALGWEFFSHGVYNTRYSYGMSEDQEREVIRDGARTISEATGQTVRGYLAPALTHTERTLDLIAEEGFTYTCDLFQDDQPQPIRTKVGRLVSMPYSLEVNDHYMLGVFGQTGQQYADTLKRQLDTLLEEGEASGTVMCVPLHAYLIGRAHRMGPFEDFLAHVASLRDEIWITRACDIADHYLAHAYDAAQADIARYAGDA